jgi:hypothetical protein
MPIPTENLDQDIRERRLAEHRAVLAKIQAGFGLAKLFQGMAMGLALCVLISNAVWWVATITVKVEYSEIRTEERVDARLDRIDARLDQMDARFDRLEALLTRPAAKPEPATKNE